MATGVSVADEEENRRLRRAVDRPSAFGDLVGASPAMREIFALIRVVASGRSNVLITGESGTGKDVVARSLHFTGARRDKPFVPISCTAMPEDLLECELFGHVRGAVAGAHSSLQGRFEQANGGTLFLDEIADMPVSLQGKLLRVVQDGEVRPVGGSRAVKVDIRLVTATHRDLGSEIEAGRFRVDLFYRLNVIPIHLPPLRERPEDIPLLAESFLRKHASDEQRCITREAMERLARYPWQGNARELENVIEHALARSSHRELRVEDLLLPGADDEPATAGANGGSMLDRAAERRLTLRELGDLYIARILELTGGNKVQAAKVLGINRRTLYRRGDHLGDGDPGAAGAAGRGGIP